MLQYIIIYLYMFLLVVAGFLMPKSRFIRVLIIIQILIFFCFSQLLDTYYYERGYRLVNSAVAITQDSEILFTLFMKIGSALGLSFTWFRIMISTISMILLNSFIMRKTEYPNMVWALYLIFSAVLDAELMRHAVALVVILYGIDVLVKSIRFRDYIKYLIIVAIAALIHSSYWFFLIFLPLWIIVKSKKHLIVFVSVILGGLVLCFSFSSWLPNLYMLLPVKMAPVERLILGQHYGNLRAVVLNFAITLFLCSPALVFSKMANDNNLYPMEDDIRLSSNPYQYGYFFRINMLFMALLIPLYYTNVVERLFRVLVILNYIFLTRCIRFDNSRKVVYKTYALIYSIVLISWSLFSYNGYCYENVWLLHLNSNPVFKFFTL